MELTLESLSPEFLNRLTTAIGDKFQLISVLGEGKNGLTFRVTAPNNNEVYCLKTIHPQTIIEDREKAASKSLEKEVAILSPLDHRCLPKIIFSGIGELLPFYVCTLHPGKTFYKLRQSNVKYPIEQSIFIISSILDTFEYLHKAGRTHCDAHQDNILIGDNVLAHGLMLIDFGSGHRASDENPTTLDKGAIQFKPPHLQPRHQREVDRVVAAQDFERYDIRAVGALLSVMREIFFADASLYQLEEYDDFCADLQNGIIATWSAAGQRLKFVVDPTYLQSSLDRYHQSDEAPPKLIHIPTSPPVRVGIAFDELIGTRAFQKLKGIKQLSFCDWVYPGAVHNRLEHSIGVFQTAIEGIEHLCNIKSFRRRYSEVHVSSVLLAALLHDVGHYPFAHVIEHYVSARFGTDLDLRAFVTHSRYSKAIIESDPQITRIIRSYFSDQHIDEIISILDGARGFLSKLLDSPIDFDKIDYLKRDSYHCGIAYGSGYETRELLEAIQYLPSRENIFFAEDKAHAVEGFLILQSQMLSGVYWNENIRAIFAMFHRFIDVCFARDLIGFRKFVSALRESRGDADALTRVFVSNYEAFVDRKEKEADELWKGIFKGSKYNDALWRLISIHMESDPNLLYRCANKFFFTDAISDQGGARRNVFQTIIKAAPGSTVTGGAIEWLQVQKLRRCYMAALEERKAIPNLLDVLVDIPWGKSAHDPFTFVDKHGKEKKLSDVSHISNSIFSDLTIFAAPIRVFLSPQMHEMAKNNFDTINAVALEKYFDPRGPFNKLSESDSI